METDRRLVPYDTIERQILVIRGQKVMLDRDLAVLYGLPVKALKQAVRRNGDRFPEDFMFVLDQAEFAHWRSQFVTSKADRMGLRYAPMVFTEFGVAMLSSVLKSPQAIQVNIRIMRAFGQMRRSIETHRALAQQLAQLEAKVGDHDEDAVAPGRTGAHREVGGEALRKRCRLLPAADENQMGWLQS